MYVKIKRLNIMSIFVILQDIGRIISISPSLKVQDQVQGQVQGTIVNKYDARDLIVS